MCSCERPAVFNDTLRKSRKPRACDECHQVIEKGEVYHAISGLWDGSWSNLDICLFCDELRRLAERDGGYCECIPIGGLEEVLAECHGGNSDEGEDGDGEQALLDAIFPFRVEQRARLAAWRVEQAVKTEAAIAARSAAQL